MPVRKRVAIIGSGAAGLQCARELHANGLSRRDVILLEARDRAGGRIHTVTYVPPPKTTTTTSTPLSSLRADGIDPGLGQYDEAVEELLLEEEEEQEQQEHERCLQRGEVGGESDDQTHHHQRHHHHQHMPRVVHYDVGASFVHGSSIPLPRQGDDDDDVDDGNDILLSGKGGPASIEDGVVDNVLLAKKSSSSSSSSSISTRSIPIGDGGGEEGANKNPVVNLLRRAVELHHTNKDDHDDYKQTTATSSSLFPPSLKPLLSIPDAFETIPDANDEGRGLSSSSRRAQRRDNNDDKNNTNNTNPWENPNLMASMCTYYVHGHRPSHPSLRKSLSYHRTMMNEVSRIGAAAYEAGEGLANTRISLAETLGVLREFHNDGRGGHHHNGEDHDDDETTEWNGANVAHPKNKEQKRQEQQHHHQHHQEERHVAFNIHNDDDHQASSSSSSYGTPVSTDSGGGDGTTTVGTSTTRRNKKTLRRSYGQEELKDVTSDPSVHEAAAAGAGGHNDNKGQDHSSSSCTSQTQKEVQHVPGEGRPESSSSRRKSKEEVAIPSSSSGENRTGGNPQCSVHGPSPPPPPSAFKSPTVLQEKSKGGEDEGSPSSSPTKSTSSASSSPHASTSAEKTKKICSCTPPTTVQLLQDFHVHLLEVWHACPASQLQLSELADESIHRKHGIHASPPDGGGGGAGAYLGGKDGHHHQPQEGNDDAGGGGSVKNRGTNDVVDDGPHCTVTTGMGTILGPLMEGVEEGIMFDHEVTSIRLVPDKKNGGRTDAVRIKAKDSFVTIEAEVCVVTIPVGCLKGSIPLSSPHTSDGRRDEGKGGGDNVGLFHPRLSAEKEEAIACLGVGRYKKVRITFDEIFWIVDHPFIGLVRPGNLDAHGSSEKGRRVHRPIGGALDIGNCLLVNNFWARDYNLPILEAVLVGYAAEHATHRSDEDILDAVLALMRDAMGRKAGRRATAAHVVDVNVSRWEEDKYSRGAYVNYCLGTMDRHVQALGKAEWDGQLVFAGEATDEVHQGSVQGALDSGTRAAREALEVLFHPQDRR